MFGNSSTTRNTPALIRRTEKRAGELKHGRGWVCMHGGSMGRRRSTRFRMYTSLHPTVDCRDAISSVSLTRVTMLPNGLRVGAVSTLASSTARDQRALRRRGSTKILFCTSVIMIKKHLCNHLGGDRKSSRSSSPTSPDGATESKEHKHGDHPYRYVSTNKERKAAKLSKQSHVTLGTSITSRGTMHRSREFMV